MNTPLAAVRAALVDLGKLVTEYQDSVGDAEVTVDDHGEIGKEMRQVIGLASSAAERAALFVRGIKAQTRDMGPHEGRAFNVVSSIREALLLLGHATRKGNCRALFEPPAEQIELYGSPVRFSQVVTNLVENAVDASLAKGGGTIKVAVTIQEQGLTLEVGDAGTGIPPEVLPRIFEPMFTTKPFGQGTGLGLSIVHDIVNGRLRRQRRRPQPARSRHHVHGEVPPREGFDNMARKYKVTQTSGYTIVLADDDPDYLEATRLLLESEGHDVLCATNGIETLALLRERRAHLLLLDYFMPGMTGEEVVVKLRQQNPYIQIILQTGYANERPPREMLRRLDIQGYYDKSEGPDRLLLWTDAGLKAASAIQRLYKSRQGLRYILDVTPGMHKIQPVADLAACIFGQIAGLLQSADVFLTARPEGETVRPRLETRRGSSPSYKTSPTSSSGRARARSPPGKRWAPLCRRTISPRSPAPSSAASRTSPRRR